MSTAERRVAFELFRGAFASWGSLCGDAAAFASRLPPGDLISISHSASQLDGLVVVWYWTHEPLVPPTPPSLDY